MPRPWSEWAEAPAAIMRTKLRAATVSLVAPQIPVWPSFTRRQGPMEQLLQQAPLLPMGQGFIAAAREKAVEMPSASENSNIVLTVGSIVLLLVIIKLLHFDIGYWVLGIQYPISNL